jgi:transposase
MHTFFGGKVRRIMPKNYDEATKARAVRLVVEHRDEYDSEYACIKAVAARIGVGPETLRKWVRQAEIDAGERDGVTTASARETRELKRKVAELEQTIEILKAATSFFVRESDPRHR